MAILVKWDNNEETIIRWDFDGRWNWDQAANAARESVELRQGKSHKVAIILNLQQSTMMKSDVFQNTVELMMLSPDDRDYIVVVGRNVYTQALVEIFRKMFLDLEHVIYSTDTLHEARRLIEMRRAGHEEEW